jgi:predicted PurR-regulated permease PerM
MESPLLRSGNRKELVVADIQKPSTSPRWSSTVKLIVGLTLVGTLAILIINFRTIIGPLLMAFILAYLLYPVADWFSKKLHFPWKLGVAFMYFLIILVLLGLLTWGGITLVDQAQQLVKFLETTVVELPNRLAHLADQPLVIGPFTIPTSSLDFDLAGLWQQISGMVQPALSRMGSLLGSMASSAMVTIGWTFFILLISYFILNETGGIPGKLMTLNVPGYREDIQKLGKALTRIWDAFLRGQLLVITITVTVYTILFSILGVKYAFWLALIAGLARLVPYAGPFVAWSAYGLVTYFQGYTIFGMQPIYYALMVVGIAWVTDFLLDNFVATRIMADVLQVHPAAVMVGAIIGASFLGIIGILLAAPVLATVMLALDYVLAKLLDQDPWARIRLASAAPPQLPILKSISKIIKPVLDRIPWLRVKE